MVGQSIACHSGMYHLTRLVLELRENLDAQIAATMQIEDELWNAQARLENAEESRS